MTHFNISCVSNTMFQALFGRRQRKKRSFQIVNAKRGAKNVPAQPGRYISATPSGAAKKMNTNICRKKKFKGNCILTVKVRETTAGSKGKEFNYRTHRVRIPKADKPTGLAFDPEFTTKAKSLRKKAPRKKARRKKA